MLGEICIELTLIILLVFYVRKKAKRRSPQYLVDLNNQINSMLSKCSFPITDYISIVEGKTEHGVTVWKFRVKTGNEIHHMRYANVSGSAYYFRSYGDANKLLSDWQVAKGEYSEVQAQEIFLDICKTISRRIKIDDNVNYTGESMKFNKITADDIEVNNINSKLR